MSLNSWDLRQIVIYKIKYYIKYKYDAMNPQSIGTPVAKLELVTCYGDGKYPANIWKWYLSCIWFEFEYIIFYSNMSQNQIMCKNAWFDFDLYLNEISLLKYESNSSHPFKLHDLKLTLFWLKILHSNKSQIPIIPKNCMMWNWLVIDSHFEWVNLANSLEKKRNIRFWANIAILF